MSENNKKPSIKVYLTLSGLYRAYLEGSPDLQEWGSTPEIARNKLIARLNLEAASSDCVSI